MQLLPLRSLIPGACAMLLIVTSAVAGIGEGNWEVGFDLGVTDFDSDVADDTGFYFDVRGGYFFGDTFQLEGQISDSSTEEGPFDISLTSLFVNAVFNFHPKEHIVPYVLLGVGSTTLDIEAFGGSLDDDAVGYQVAVGSRFFVGSRKKMAVRVELIGLSEDSFDDRSRHLSLVAGLSWRLGAAP